MVKYGFIQISLTNNSLEIQQVRETRCETSTASWQTCPVWYQIRLLYRDMSTLF